MRMFFTFLVNFSLVVFTFNQLSSQTINQLSNSVSENNIPNWNPINEFLDSNNVMQTSPDDVGQPVITNKKNGVLFYGKTCKNNQESTAYILKLRNTNDYLVNISWKVSYDSPLTIITLNPNSEKEGVCSNTLEDSLMIQFPKEKKIQEVKQSILSTLEIKKVSK